jgi:hypothetical protein
MRIVPPGPWLPCQLLAGSFDLLLLWAAARQPAARQDRRQALRQSGVRQPVPCMAAAAAGTKRTQRTARAQRPARLTTARCRRGPSQLDCATQHPPEMPPKKKVVAPPKKAIVKKAAAAAAAAAAAKQKATKEGVPGLGCDTIARCARTPSRVYHVPAGHCHSPRQVLAAFHHAG